MRLLARFFRLSVAFGAIVGDAEHLAVLGRASAALAPCGNVVGVHFGELIYLALVGGMADCAERTIGFAIGFGSLRLLGVDGLLDRFVEHPYIQELRIDEPPRE